MGESAIAKLNRWVTDTPLRSLNKAYEAAVAIQQIEATYFGSEKIAPDGTYGRNVDQYFQIQLRKYLQTIDVRLAEFRTSSTLTNLPQPEVTPTESSDPNSPTEAQNGSASNGSAPPDTPGETGTVLAKLQFIDQITSKYRRIRNQSDSSVAEEELEITRSTHPPDPTSKQQNPPPNGKGQTRTELTRQSSEELEGYATADPTHHQNGRNHSPERSTSPGAPPQTVDPDSPTTPRSGRNRTLRKSEPVSGKTGILPRSILRTFTRLGRELNPDYEEEVVTAFRDSRSRTIISIRFLILLAVLPLLTQILSKNLLFEPLINHFHNPPLAEIALSPEFEEKAIIELEHFKERMEFERLISADLGEVEEESVEPEEILRQKANEILSKYRKEDLEGLKNVLADLSSLAVFGWLIFIGREEIEVLKSFLDQIIYGLSDSAKAFIIILFTDIFVGYHSPHGWEVLLAGISRHLGVAENQEFNYAFIATFPVILDTLFKYWIFRYLNRVSPSAVATYRNMNE